MLLKPAIYHLLIKTVSGLAFLQHICRMRYIIPFFLIIVMVVRPFTVDGQTTNQFSGWLAAFGRVGLNEKFSLYIESQLRSTNDIEQVQTILVRVGLNYDLKSNQILTVGYGYFSNRRTVDSVTGYVPENRIWEQYILNEAFNSNLHSITIQNRFRLEQRFIGQPEPVNGQLQTSSFEFAQRIRYFARMIVPFQKTPGGFKKGAFFSLQDEVFFNIGDLSVVNGKTFDQNRAYFSIGYRFSPKNDTEIGYMNQFVLNSGTARTINNIVQLATYIRL